MGLSPGTRLGPYEIAAQLGAGGMGEVYRARDTRLGRDVAIKVLPPGVTSTPEARARFEREARLVSQLNHPNICTLHDVGREGETDYLVMELIKGGSLQERLALKNALPLEEVLALGTEIADALEAAHARGIVHRDLKPGNVLLTERGHAKVMDFGLALRARRGARSLGMSSVSSGASTEAEEHLTSPGLAVGTVAYMSPEQARGEEVDARSDLFSLGAVLYEMASGHRAFEGNASAVIFEAILNRMPPPVSMLRAELPRELDRILEKALEKDRELRYQSAAEVRSDLKRLRRDVDSGRAAEAGAGSAGRRVSGSRATQPVPLPASAVARRRLVRFALGAAGIVVIAGVALVATQVARHRSTQQAIRLAIETPPSVAAMTAPRISPDGRYLAFGASDSTGSAGLGYDTYRIWVRPMDGTTARPLSGTEGASRPFWSPNSRSIGFISGGKLRTLDVAGGQPVTVCDVSATDGSWGRSGDILLDGGPCIQVVKSTGGEPTQATWLDKSRGETGHSWPQFLPDGKHFLYLAAVAGRRDSTALRVGRLGSRDSKILEIGDLSRVEYAPPGYLLYLRNRTLLARPFDASGLRMTGDAFPVVDDVLTADAAGNAMFSASATGTLVYRDEVAVTRSRLVWKDRAGRELGSLGSAAKYGFGFAISPDERRVAASIAAPGESSPDIWILDVARDVASRFTSDPAPDYAPVWSADGATIYFKSDRTGHSRVWQKPSSGLGEEKELPMPPGDAYPSDASRDGRFLLVGVWPAGGRTEPDIAMVTLGPEPKTTPLLTSEFEEWYPSLSPDGKWLSYTSNESGRREVYVVSFPGPAAKYRVSAEGGELSRWSADGKEIFYTAPSSRGLGRALMSAAVSTAPTFRVLGTPVRLFDMGPGGWQFAPASSGRKFLTDVSAKGEKLASTNVLLNWPASVRRQ